MLMSKTVSRCHIANSLIVRWPLGESRFEEDEDVNDRNAWRPHYYIQGCIHDKVTDALASVKSSLLTISCQLVVNRKETPTSPTAKIQFSSISYPLYSGQKQFASC